MESRQYRVGDSVEVYDMFNGTTYQYTGKVVRITACFVCVSYRGSVYRYRRETGRIAGYAWPQFCHVIAPAL
jgi:small-conductance mechanosensitive channel